MPSGIRVRLDPLQATAADGQFLADGALIGLELFGAFSSRAELDSPRSAKLTLHAKFLSRVRGNAQTESAVLASLSGELTRTAGKVRFVGEADETGKPVGLASEEQSEEEESVGSNGDATTDAQTSASEPEQRVLRFAFRTDQFEKVLTEDANTAEIVISVDTAKFHYLKISAELEIDGTAEAAESANDVLDVLITADNPPPVPEVLSLRLTDEQGDALPGANCRIVSGAKGLDGSTDLVADGEGVVEIRPTTGSSSCDIAWGAADSAKQPFTHIIFLALGRGDQALERRLRNLGFTAGPGLEDDVRVFQHEFGKRPTGRVADITTELIAWHDRGERPTTKPPDAVDSEPIVFNGPPDDVEDLSDSPDTAVA